MRWSNRSVMRTDLTKSGSFRFTIVPHSGSPIATLQTSKRCGSTSTTAAHRVTRITRLYVRITQSRTSSVDSTYGDWPEYYSRLLYRQLLKCRFNAIVSRLIVRVSRATMIDITLLCKSMVYFYGINLLHYNFVLPN